MMLRVVGASRHAIRQLRAIAPSGVLVVDEPIAEPDWVLVATGSQRLEALALSRLPPYRVLEVPEIAGSDQLPTDALRAALATMSSIGARAPVGPSLGVRIAAMVVRRMMK
jgi:hypothetical protein